MTVVRYLHLVAIAFSSAGSSSSSRQSCRRFAVGPIENRGRSYLGDFDEIVLATSFHSPGGGSIST